MGGDSSFPVKGTTMLKGRKQRFDHCHYKRIHDRVLVSCRERIRLQARKTHSATIVVRVWEKLVIASALFLKVV